MPSTISEAEEYERFGYPHTTQQDCDFLEALFTAPGREIHQVLDIACGTGRHALEMARRGYQVTGIDISEDMLQAARRAASAQELEVTFLRKDMRSLDFTAAFDAAYILFNTMTLLSRNEELIAFLRGVHTALGPAGLLLLEVPNLWPYIARGQLANSDYSGDEEQGGVRRHRHMEIVIGPYNNLLGHRFSHRYWRDGEELEPRAEAYDLRIFSLNELDLLCRLAGFQILDLFGDMDVTKRIEAPHTTATVEDTYPSYVLVLGKA